MQRTIQEYLYFTAITTLKNKKKFLPEIFDQYIKSSVLDLRLGSPSRQPFIIQDGVVKTVQ